MTGGEVPEHRRLAYAALTRLGEPGDPRLIQCVRALGPEATVEMVRSGDVDSYTAARDGSAPASIEGASNEGGARARPPEQAPPEQVLAGYRSRLNAGDPAEDLARVERAGGSLLVPGDPGWPDALSLLETVEISGRGGVPLALWVRGTPSPGSFTRSCALVGARAASEYGTYVTSEIGAGLTDLGITVLSGGAFGIDAAAHRGALSAGGTTVAVLASGVDVPYPRAHAALFDRIAEQGLLASEVPPGCPPTRPRFLVRNRLIAALGRGTVVVEAALRSGSLNTATWAGLCSRPVMGVPGPVTSASSAGVHQLIRLGATMVTDAAEIAEHIAPIGEDIAPVKRGESRSRDDLAPDVREVLEAVPVRRAGSAATIAAAAGVGADVALSALGRLLLGGYVERDEAGWRLAETEWRRSRHSTSAPQ